MAAGLGFKTFTTGEVLTAADVNGYLMQGVLVFATEAARNSAITSPQEGQFAFTKDTNSLWYYSGSAWVASGATGDIEGVTAGTGISGGGTSGTVTITNSMATAIDAKGDLVPGTGADTFSRLAVGANGTVLTADSAETTGLKWAAPAGATFIGVQVYNSAAQSTSNSTDFYPDFDSESWDTNAFHSTSSNTSRLTVPSGQGGKYFVYAVGGYTGNTAGYRRFTISINRTSELFNNFITPDTGSCVITFTGVVELVATDYVEVLTSQTSGGALNYLGGAGYSSFGMYKIG